MIRVVLDTNVLASGLVGRGQSPPAQILDAWRIGSFSLVVSEHLLTELARTLNDPYFRRRLTSEHIAASINLLNRRAIVASTKVRVEGVATHQEDDLTLATAISAGARYLVTGDKKIQDLRHYRGVRIVSPREFLDILALGASVER